MAATVEVARAPRPFYDHARFYPILGSSWPSVTTILNVINKPALGPWYAKEERRAFETAMLELASRVTAISGDQLLDAVIRAVDGVKAGDRTKQKAATIGTAVHAGVEWHARKLLGDDPGPPLTLPDAAVLAVESWKDWAKSVEFRPLAVERTVYCAACGYAGMMDFLGYVRDVVTVGDWKTGKAIYAESYLQNVAYRHAVMQDRVSPLPNPTQGLIIRLPKLLDDPVFEVAPVPATVTIDDFLAALRLWRWQRAMDGKPTGTPGAGH